MGSLNREQAVITRQISELSKKVSLDDSDLKKDEVAEQLIKELNAFLISLKNEKKISLEGDFSSFGAFYQTYIEHFQILFDYYIYFEHLT